MINKIAYFLGRNDEEPNISLAIELCKTKNKFDIKEIIIGLSNKTAQIANDCIKVLYEIGDREPSLISEYTENFINLLKSNNNRLVWGAMTALSKIASLNPKEIYENLDAVINAYKKGSVITVDNSISVFAELVKADRMYAKKVFPIILKHLETCIPREVGQHSERAFVCITENNSEDFKNVLMKRYGSLTESQKKRVDKLLKKINGKKFFDLQNLNNVKNI